MLKNKSASDAYEDSDCDYRCRSKRIYDGAHIGGRLLRRLCRLCLVDLRQDRTTRSRDHSSFQIHIDGHCLAGGCSDCAAGG